MKYIELLTADRTIVSVISTEQPSFVKYVRRNNIFVGCRENEAEAICIDNQIACLPGHEYIKSVRDDVILDAIFIDQFEYDRLNYLASTKEDEEPQVNDTEQSTTENIMSELDFKVELVKLKEATNKYFKTVSDPSTNSIAKIRAAAQQSLEGTSTSAEDV